MELQSYFGSLLNNLSFFKLLQCGWVGENENTFEQQLQAKPKSRKLSKKRPRKLNFSFAFHL